MSLKSFPQALNSGLFGGLPGQARVGLVLGAGGPVGHAFHAGVLQALSTALQWDPRTAELIVGTSAGAQVAALLRAGMHAKDLMARATNGPLSAAGAAMARCFVRPDHRRPKAGAALRLRPSSPRYFARALRAPLGLRPGHTIAALLPEGRVCLQAQVDGLRKIFGDVWPAQGLWITAVCLASGQRVAFGRAGDPLTDVGTAVACSGAVPAICIPVSVHGRRYIDGGVASATHVGLLVDERLDLLIISSPLSAYAPMRLLLRRELRSIVRRNIPTLVLEPAGETAVAMGWNPLDPARAAAVACAAHRQTLQQLGAGEPMAWPAAGSAVLGDGSKS